MKRSMIILVVVVALLLLVLVTRKDGTGGDPAVETDPSADSFFDGFTRDGAPADTPTEVTGTPTPTDTSTPAPTPTETSPSTGGGSTPPTTTQPPVAKNTLYFSYAEAVRGSEYVLSWSASRGARATIVLAENGVTVAAIDNCTNMTVAPGVTKHCTWIAEVPERSKIEKVQFILRTFATDGTLLDTVTSRNLAYVDHSTFLPIPHKDDVYGWSVRYPESWKTLLLQNRASFAQQSTGLALPPVQDESFSVEVCSLARESCITRVDAFKAASGVTVGTLAGKRSSMRIYSHQGAFVREDLLERDNIAYFVSQPALTAGGLIRSTLVRESVAQFSYETARREVHEYELAESFRAGTLLIEAQDNLAYYVRIFTGARGCSTALETDTFLEDSIHNIQFKKNGCTIKIREQGSGYEIEETDCEPLYTGECRFKGTYNLVN